MKSIYQYNDHKTYLNDWFTEKKNGPSGFSFKQFSKVAGLGSPNYMKLIIGGKRNLTSTNIHQIASALTLSFDETQYFEALTQLQQSKTNVEKKYYKQRLKIIKANKPHKSFNLSELDLLSEWYFPAVTVCLNNSKAATAIAKVKEKTGLNEAQIKLTIDILKKKNLLLEENGIYKLEFSHFIAHDKKAISEINKKYIREQLKMSSTIFEKKYSLGPKFFCHTFTVSTDSFQKYVDYMAQFIDQITNESNTEAPDEIIQLNMQLFKLLDR
ncbi:MAG: TIGR02147 family protein [Oligoflexia bacterium]|nr:TIGR02147 family protein [Oligoflexia bacterium]